MCYAVAHLALRLPRLSQSAPSSMFRTRNPVPGEPPATLKPHLVNNEAVKPVVTLMASAAAKGEWYPLGVPYRALHCATCVADIPYDDVLAAVRELMAEAGFAKQVPLTDGILA